MSDTIGLLWEHVADTYEWLENLAGLSVAQVTAYCNTISPYKGMSRVNITDNGAITAVQNAKGTGCGYDDSIAGVAANGQAMWLFPPYYYWTHHTPLVDNTYRWFISPTGAETDTISSESLPEGYTPPDPIPWKRHPAFIRNGLNVPWIALGAFEGYVNGSKLESKVGVIPTTGYTIDQFRTYAQNRGAGWGIQDFYTTQAMQLAFIIQNGGFNSWGWEPQNNSLGRGITTICSNTDNNEPNRVTGVRTGWTSQLAADNGGVNLGNTTGQGVPFTTSAADGLVSPDTPATGVRAISWYGLENPYGNVLKFIDGINLTPDGEIWITNNTSGFHSETYTQPYNDTLFQITEHNGAWWPDDIVYNSTYDWSLSPAMTQGNPPGPQTYMCSEIISYAGWNGLEPAVMAIGGVWSAYWEASLFTTYYEANYGYNTPTPVGARLMYIPQG